MNLKADMEYSEVQVLFLSENVEELEINTPYGSPSDSIALADYEGKRIAFATSWQNHQYPPIYFTELICTMKN